MLMRAPKEIEQKISAEIEEGSIIYESVAATLMCNSLDVILRDIDNRIRAIYRKHGINAKPADTENIITGMSRYSKAVHNALYWFERDIEPRITDCTFGSAGGVKSYDDFRYSANELVQIVLLCIDRGQYDGAMAKIFRYLDRLKKGTRFSDEDIERFVLKTENVK